MWSWRVSLIATVTWRKLVDFTRGSSFCFFRSIRIFSTRFSVASCKTVSRFFAFLFLHSRNWLKGVECSPVATSLTGWMCTWSRCSLSLGRNLPFLVPCLSVELLGCGFHPVSWCTSLLSISDREMVPPAGPGRFDRVVVQKGFHNPGFQKAMAEIACWKHMDLFIPDKHYKQGSRLKITKPYLLRNWSHLWIFLSAKRVLNLDTLSIADYWHKLDPAIAVTLALPPF